MAANLCEVDKREAQERLGTLSLTKVIAHYPFRSQDLAKRFQEDTRHQAVFIICTSTKRRNEES